MITFLMLFGFSYLLRFLADYFLAQDMFVDNRSIGVFPYWMIFDFIYMCEGIAFLALLNSHRINFKRDNDIFIHDTEMIEEN